MEYATTGNHWLLINVLNRSAYLMSKVVPWTLSVNIRYFGKVSNAPHNGYSYPVEVFCSMRHWSFGAQSSNEPWYTVALCGILWPNGAIDGKSGDITQYAWIHTTRRAAFISRRLSLAGFCARSHFAFSVKPLFLSTWVQMPLKPATFN